MNINLQNLKMGRPRNQAKPRKFIDDPRPSWILIVRKVRRG